MSNPFGVCLEPECHDEPKLPSLTDMAKGFVGSAKDIISGVVAGEGLIASDEVYNHRMKVCGGCEFFIKEDKRCSKCGCFMEAKSKFIKTNCPMDKWGADV
jgi:hypothetical protein